jgi:hypothetical protein
MAWVITMPSSQVGDQRLDGGLMALATILLLWHFQI